MSSGLDALRVAHALALRQRDAARKTLQDLLAVQQAARVRLDQLQDYAHDTESRWGMQAGARLQPEVLYHQHQFMARLDEVVRIQIGLVADQTVHVDSARRALLAAQQRLTSLRQLIDKRCHDSDRQQRRSEQKQTDERAALQWYRHAGAGFQGQEY